MARVANGGLLELSIDYTAKTVQKSRSTGSVVTLDGEGQLATMMYSVAVSESDDDTAFIVWCLALVYMLELRGLARVTSDGSGVLQRALAVLVSRYAPTARVMLCFFHAFLQSYTKMYKPQLDKDDGGVGPMAKSWLRDILFCARTPSEHRACAAELKAWLRDAKQTRANPYIQELLAWIEHVLKDEAKLGNAFMPIRLCHLGTQSGHNESDNNALKAEQGRLMARNLEALGTNMGGLLKRREAKKVVTAACTRANAGPNPPGPPPPVCQCIDSMGLCQGCI